MAATNKIVIKDEAKGIAFEHTIQSIYISGGANVSKTLVRDPGEKSEMRIDLGVTNVSVNYNGDTATAESLAATLKAHPVLIPVLEHIAAEITKSMNFPAK